uniref:Uncharacterized protein n=1 Tax=Arundo donax TaxID=35708 RepID=A0A0A9B184_ARUDO
MLNSASNISVEEHDGFRTSDHEQKRTTGDQLKDAIGLVQHCS